MTRAILASLALILPVSGCTEQRIVRSSGLLENIVAKREGQSQNQLASVEPGSGRAANPVFMIPDGKIRYEDEDGEITLYAKRVKHLMTHIISTIENDEPELFVEQVLSKHTIAEFNERGLDPALAFDELKRRKRDIYEFFYVVPMGEATPGVYLEQLGTNMFRMAVPRGRHPELHWVGMDASFEGGNYKLRWFVR